MSSRRILFFMHTTSTVGGVETWLDRACDSFSKAGFAPTVGLVRGLKFNQPQHYKERHPDLDTIEVDGRGLNREGRVRALMRAIGKAKPRIVIPLGIVDANEAAIRGKQRGLDVRLVHHAQGNLAPMLADLRHYRDWIDQIVCPGRLTQQVLIHWASFPEARVRHVPNGADEPLTKPAPKNPAGTLNIGYIGRLSQHDKRALDLAGFHEELEQLKVDYHLDIVGDGSVGPELKKRISSPRVTFHGALPHDEVYRKIYPRLDVLVLFSDSEAFGIVLAEAMMHGVVPVTSEYKGFHAEQLVIPGQTGLSFPVGDTVTAGQQVAQLASHREQLAALAQAGIEHARQYTWERSLTAWTRAMERIASREPIVGDQYPTYPGESDQGARSALAADLLDAARRGRRALFGSPVPPGGEEWPLYCRKHDQHVLDAATAALSQYDCRPDGMYAVAGDERGRG